MQQRFQLGRWLCGLGLCAALVLPGVSAQNRSDRPPARQQPPPRQQQAPPRPANPAPRNDRSSGSYHPQGSPQGRTQESPRPQGSDRSNRQPPYPNRQPSSADRGRANDNRAPGNANPRAYDNGRGNRNDRPQNSYRQQTPAAPPPDVQQRLRNCPGGNNCLRTGNGPSRTGWGCCRICRSRRAIGI